jgi:protein-tyrosine phosphatase
VIDLHCHLLPGIDDGAPELDAALRMARIAVDDA